jgi:16S rRNA (guanine(966)-N(2))-methyltransferase RsmD
MEKTQIRIVAGSLRGRKLNVTVHPGLRPTPQRVRESFFSILGNAIPDRPFVDLFAGTGVVGLEALSRGASAAIFIERDHRLGNDIDAHLRAFGVNREGQQTKLLAGSILTVQGEDTFDSTALPDAGRWEARKYGRNVLLFWEPAET